MKCRLCGEKNVQLLINFGEQPIVHNLKKTVDEISKKYSFKLGHCTNCDLLQLIDCIDPNILYENYFTLSSWKNQPHVERLITVMEDITGIQKDSNILEIGCNDGSFLQKLNELNYKKLFGIEPTNDAYNAAITKLPNIHHGFFGKDTAQTLYKKNFFDVVVTRQVLEHITDLEDFLQGINLILSDEGHLIIEVPDSNWNLEHLDYALWEEHVNYFTKSTLEKLLALHGFSIIHYETTLFSGKALTVFCQRNKDIKNSVIASTDKEKIEKYKNEWPEFKDGLRKFLLSQEKPIVIYGCGARSSTFLNFTSIGDLIEAFIDDQPEKQNLLVPGSDIPIKPWDEKYRNYTILLGVNTENEHKVIQKRQLDKKSTYSVLPPSSLIPEFWNKLIHD
ncbi:MAG: class I SAM-dependent methyltransferase [Sulfuricurvum sp.]|jgi:2-polyprenyl-3-methyl-5-hydroxy-6-metoxy-1,4-benzoquinol methylase